MFNELHRPAAVAQSDYQFEAVVSLHARALLATEEVQCLLRGGFPDGALSRWRTVHEVAITALFIAQAGQDTALRFLASFDIQAWKAAKHLERHGERARMDTFTPEEFKHLEARKTRAVQRFGVEILNPQGWAYPAISKKRPTIADIEEAVQLDHWRPRYHWASEYAHGGHKPWRSLLATSEASEPILAVGASNSGFADPAHMTAISLLQATAALLRLRPTIDTAVALVVLQEVEAEVGQAFASVEHA